MEIEDYFKLPKLRIVATKEIGTILRASKILSIKEISPNNRWRYHCGKRSVPIKYLFKDKNTLKKILDLNPLFVTHGGVYVKLPRKINEDLSYVCGLISGDGNLFVTNKRDYLISIHNKEIALLQKAITIFENNFGHHIKVKQGHHCFKVEARSEVIHSFFNKVTEIESGRKKNIVIPKKLKENRFLVRSFIAGFFDAEGSVNLQKNQLTCQISFAQKQKAILEEIAKELEKEGIKTKLRKAGTNIWSLYGNKSSLAPFYEKIPFVHPKKREKLETAVNNQTKFSECCKNPKLHFLASTS